jgi:hypothetical protein
MEIVVVSRPHGLKFDPSRKNAYKPVWREDSEQAERLKDQITFVMEVL